MFDLTFWDTTGMRLRFKRWHDTEDSATTEAYRVLGRIRDRAAHPAIIHGPGLPPDGWPVR